MRKRKRTEGEVRVIIVGGYVRKKGRGSEEKLMRMGGKIKFRKEKGKSMGGEVRKRNENKKGI